MAKLAARVKKLESALSNVVKVQRAQGRVIIDAVTRISRLDGKRKSMGLPAGRPPNVVILGMHTRPAGRPRALSSTRRTPPREAGGVITAPGEWMRFEFSEGRSNKFWKVRLQGSTFVTHWGRIGQNGQETVNRYRSPAEARSEGEKLIASKIRKGYQLVR